MALPEVSYEDYKQLGGKLKDDAFNDSLRAAKAAVRELIGFNEPRDTFDANAYTCAVCAAVDVDAAYGASAGIGEGASAFSIGSYSESGGSQGKSAYDTDMSRVIRRELIGSSLLFQGLGR